MKKRFRLALKLHARQIFYWALVLGAGSFLLLYRLGSLTRGLSRDEAATLAHSLSLRVIANDPLNLPLTGLQWLSLHVSRHHYFLARLPSVFLGVVALLCLAYILQRWYGRRPALFGLMVIAGSGWFLHVSRSASPDILYFCAVPALLTVHLLLRDYPEKLNVRLAWLVVNCLLLFVPGLVWLVLLNGILQIKDLREMARTPGRVWQVGLQGVVFVGLLGYLGAALARHQDLLATWLGLPASFDTWQLHGVRLLQSVSYFAVRGPHLPALWLGRLPILNAVTLLMLLAGVLFYGRHYKAGRTHTLAAYFVVGALLFALNGAVSFSLLVPIVFIIAVAGIAYLLHTWLKVFPRNPLARGVGIAILCVALGLSVVYNARAYFVAWPHNLETRRAMQYAPPVRAPKTD